ncbi:MAG: 50S ribosomal protein L25 [Patescibacteria group bacterium]
MMKAIKLEAALRDVQGKQVEKLRRVNQIPAVLYGHGVKNVNLLLDRRTFECVYREAGTSSLVELSIGGHASHPVLIHDVQRDPVSGAYLHADFLQVKMTEKITTDVSLRFVGESKVVKELGGILVKPLDSLKVECLPQYLVQNIAVDISSLSTFDDMVRVRDLLLPEGITVKDPADTVLANVQAPRTEEELKELEDKVEEKVEDVASVVKEKPTDEEAAATAEAAPATKPAEKKDKKDKKDKK